MYRTASSQGVDFCPVLPAIYIVAAGLIEILLLLYKPNYTFPGLGIMLLGVPVYYLWRRKEGAST